MGFVKTFLQIAFAEFLIYVGICFLSGQLLPQLLESVHATWPKWVKLIAFAFLISIPANLIMSWGFKSSGPAYAGIVYAGFAVFGAMVTAVLVEGATVNWQTTACLLVMVLSAGAGIISLRSSIP